MVSFYHLEIYRTEEKITECLEITYFFLSAIRAAFAHFIFIYLSMISWQAWAAVQLTTSMSSIGLIYSGRAKITSNSLLRLQAVYTLCLKSQDINPN